jgi:hypothetical protein
MEWYTIRWQSQEAAPILNAGDMNYIASLLDANPALYLDEIHDRLLQYRNVDVSQSTLSRAMHRMALSHKKVSPEALERNELLRATWQAAHAEIPADYIVWLDESSVDNRTNHRKRGWAQVGRACTRREFFARGQRFSVLPALACVGYIAVDIFEGSVNKERFMTFLRQQVVRLMWIHEMRAHPSRMLTTSVQHLPMTRRRQHGWLVEKNYNTNKLRKYEPPRKP